MTKYVLSLLSIALILGACSTGSQSESSTQIVEKYPDGKSKKIIVSDPLTQQKIQEKDFYPDQKTYREWTFNNGLKNGICRSFYQNGNPWSLNTYTNDTLNGEYKTWHENGQLYISGNYEMGLRSGVWRFFAPTGELLQERSFLGLPDSLRTE